MTYQEFKRELFQYIVQQEEAGGKIIRLLEKGYTSDECHMRMIIKCINMSRYGREDTIVQDDYIHVTCDEDSIVSMMYWSVQDCFGKYKTEGWAGVLPDIMSKLQRMGNCREKLQEGVKGYDYYKDRLIIRPINYENNKYELESCIYWKYGDIAMTLYCIVQDSDTDFITLKVTRSITLNWQMTDDAILTNALLNSYEKMPPRLYHTTDLRRRHDLFEGCFMPEDSVEGVHIDIDNQMEGILGYRLTTARNVNGSLAVFYPGVQERLGELMKGDYFIGFTSIHEAVIHPVEVQSAYDIQESIKNINAIFDQEEMLTNKVYRYCREKRELVEV